ncbi:MAG TPA: mitochondrial fission ELM1 family protein [Rhodanobacter sp.]|nr:mitochondrial fission ELM1 family protein [Rhodanobacter sp.]
MIQADGCWVITDHAAGNQRQALALAAGLGLRARHLQLQPQAPWSWLAPRCTLGGRYALPAGQRKLLAAPWPPVAIGCGRSAALCTRLLRKLGGGACYTVQILDPRAAPRHWDLVIAPRHDGLRDANVLNPLGSLNPINDAWLTDARGRWPRLGELPSPRIGVLLGGPRHGVALDGAYARQLAQRLLATQERHGGSLLVMASRRTPDALIAPFQAQVGLAWPGLVWRRSDDGPNPYAGVLGWSDTLVVTPDSVNMLSEACAVGCPVHTWVNAPLPAKLASFHQALRDGGWLHDLDTTGPFPGVPPLRETAAIADMVKTRIAEHLRRH